MNSLVEKTATILPILEERGTVYFFAVAELEITRFWDIILCSEWSDHDWAGSVRFVIDTLWPILEDRERCMTARVNVIKSWDLDWNEVPTSWHGIVPADNKEVYAHLLGTDIRRGVIYKVQLPPLVLAGRSLARKAVPAA